MEKTYKRVPFDVELAKKIQSGEIEGRFVTALDNIEMEILTFNSFDKKYPIIARYKDTDSYGVELFEYCIDGKTNSDGVAFWFDLLIELPEEPPKPEFKIGDYVEIVDGGHKGNCGTILSDKMIHYRREDVYCYYVGIPSIGVKADIRVQFLKKKKFKPFDKVLVKRNGGYGDTLGTWTPAFFQKYVTEYGETQYLASGLNWHKCIPYEGNEHLVGTINSQDED